MTPQEKAAAATELHSFGYRFFRDIDGERYACIVPFLYTVAIITGRWVDWRDCYDDRWCYRTAQGALDGLKAWEAAGFEGEPTGWHRHPDSGRRVAEDGREYVRQ